MKKLLSLMIEAEPDSYLFVEFYGTPTAVKRIEIKVQDKHQTIPHLITDHLAKAIKQGIKGIQYKGETYNRWKISTITYGTNRIPEDLKRFLSQIKAR